MEYIFSFKEASKEMHWCCLDGIRKKVLSLYKKREISTILFTCIGEGNEAWYSEDERISQSESTESASWTPVPVFRLLPSQATVSFPQEVHRSRCPRGVARSSVSIWITWYGRGFVLCFWPDRMLLGLFSFTSGAPPEGRQSDRYIILISLF